MIARRSSTVLSKCQVSSTIVVAVLCFIEASAAQTQTTLERDAEKPGRAPAIWLNDRDLPTRPSEKLQKFLRRIGPNVRASTNYHDYRDIGLDESIEAWRLLHEQARSIAQDQVELFQTHIDRLLREANVTGACLNSANQALLAMKRLDSWALEMWSATGNFPPVGLIDGHVTDVGSYKGCIDIPIPREPRSTFTNYTSYCVVPFRPITPARPRFHSVFKQLPLTLVNQFNTSDFFHTLALKAQYFYYLYRKTGICVPSSCSPGDVQQITGLIARRLALSTGPVKCFTKAPPSLATSESKSMEPYLRHEVEEISFGKIENEPILVQINKSLNRKQLVALILVCSFFAIVLVSTVWHAIELFIIGMRRKPNEADDESPTKVPIEENIHHSNTMNGHASIEVPISTPDPKRRQQSALVSGSSGLKYLVFYYFSMITNGHEFLNTSLRSNEIKCLHGLRVLTMFWIICVHTMQYNEWSGFTRVYSTEDSLGNPAMQPMINANYVVDNFFLMSGLLAAYTTWFANKGTSTNFSIWTSLLSRYLRLTPQAFLVSLLYILLPLAGDGPFWYDMTHDPSKNCEKNWWVNLLHLQAFYREDEMCNLVGWWISVDMFYYVIAVFLLWMMLNGKLKRAAICTLALVFYCTVVTAYRHYAGGFTPNNLGNVPQIDEVWSEYVVSFNWSPYPHAYVFFLGLWIGYILANNKWKYQIQRLSSFGWAVSLLTLIVVNLSSHIWVSGAYEPTNQAISTSYNVVCAILWANAFGWIIAALHYGSLPSLSRLLSTDLSVMLSKASFIIYLSHMLLIRMVFGKQYYTLEVSAGLLLYLMIGNIFVSVIFGVFLCIAFEGPCMKFQRWILANVKQNKKLPVAGASYSIDNGTIHQQVDKITLSLGPTSMAMLK